jgi:hypothetical protein
MDPVGFVMSKKMLRTIKKLAEAASHRGTDRVAATAPKAEWEDHAKR